MKAAMSAALSQRKPTKIRKVITSEIFSSSNPLQYQDLKPFPYNIINETELGDIKPSFDNETVVINVIKNYSLDAPYSDFILTVDPRSKTTFVDAQAMHDSGANELCVSEEKVKEVKEEIRPTHVKVTDAAGEISLAEESVTSGWAVTAVFTNARRGFLGRFLLYQIWMMKY